ncbi:MAG: MATE family efflux transporter [Lachnospiraceae bacterium]|nr:MATE family efflux transporter [Lachnospiraceae bacterium]
MENNHKRKFQTDLTEGNVAKQLLRFSLPFMLSMLIQQSYMLIDILIISHFAGEASVAGVNNGGQLTFLAMSFAIGISVGGTILIGQYFGAKRKEEVQRTAATIFTTMLIISLIMMVIFLPFSNMMLRGLRVPDESYQEAFRYLTISLCGLPFIFMFNAISGILRGLGESKLPLIFVAAASLLSAILDLILIGIFRFDAAGAALSTVFAQALCVVVSVIYLTRNGFMFDFKPKSFVIHKDKLKLILKLGVPAGLSQVVVMFSFLLMSVLVNGYGVSVAAAVGLAGRFNGIAIMPLIALGNSVSMMCAQNLGANRHDRAMRTAKNGIGISLVIGVLLFIVAQLFPRQIMAFFSTSLPVVEAGIIYLKSSSWDYLIVPFVFCLNGLVTGAGHANISLINTFISSVAIRIPAAIFLSTTAGLALSGIGFAIPTATIGALIFLVAYLLTGRWRTITIHKSESESR